MTTLATCILPIAIIVSGYASYYAPGVMDATVAQRREWQQLPAGEFDGYVARPLCNEIGDVVQLRHDGGAWERHAVADCARRDNGDGALSWMQSNGILVEVDWHTWQRWGRDRTHGGAAVEMMIVDYAVMERLIFPK